MYAIVRHSKSTIVNMIVVLLAIISLVFIATSRIYLGLQFPSDLVAGYVFGGVWVCFIILLIEGSRLLNIIKLSINK
jgi:membrane-associated phospholipid phosphatase